MAPYIMMDCDGHVTQCTMALSPAMCIHMSKSSIECCVLYSCMAHHTVNDMTLQITLCTLVPSPAVCIHDLSQIHIPQSSRESYVLYPDMAADIVMDWTGHMTHCTVSAKHSPDQDARLFHGGQENWLKYSSHYFLLRCCFPVSCSCFPLTAQSLAVTQTLTAPLIAAQVIN